MADSHFFPASMLALQVHFCRNKKSCRNKKFLTGDCTWDLCNGAWLSFGFMHVCGAVKAAVTACVAGLTLFSHFCLLICNGDT